MRWAPQQRACRRSVFKKTRDKAKRLWKQNKLFFYLLLCVGLAIAVELGDPGLTTMKKPVPPASRTGPSLPRQEAG